MERLKESFNHVKITTANIKFYGNSMKTKLSRYGGIYEY